MHTLYVIVFKQFLLMDNNTAYTVIAREMAPGAASENMFVPEDKSSSEGN